MKKIITSLFIAGIFLSVSVSAQKSPACGPFTSQTDSISYAIGYDMGNNMRMNGMQVNTDFLFEGIKNALAGNDSLFTPEQTRQLFSALQQQIMKQQAERSAAESATNHKIGEEFLAKNKTEVGVKTTASGLQYKVLKEGSGKNPGPESVVEVHYTGKLLNGTVFDSSVERGQPITFSLNQVIPGWTEGVQLMKPGAKYIFYIPSGLAYGDNPTGPIPAGSTLIFEVELLSIKE